jgi:hypothetical protein
LIGRQRLTLWNALLVAGACLLLLGLYSTWWGVDKGNVPAHAVKGPQVPTAPRLRDQQPMAAFMVVSQKNLFSQDRRGPDQKQGNNRNYLEGHQLLGVIIVGETRAALIGSKTLPHGRKAADIEVVYAGDQWNGLKVKKITNESVIFLGKDGPKTLTFPEE